MRRPASDNKTARASFAWRAHHQVSGDFSAVVWNASSGRLLHRLVQTAFPERSHRAARVFPKGDRIVTGASGTVGGGAIIWDTTTGKALAWNPHCPPPPSGDTRRRRIAVATLAYHWARAIWRSSGLSAGCLWEPAPGSTGCRPSILRRSRPRRPRIPTRVLGPDRSGPRNPATPHRRGQVGLILAQSQAL